MGNEQLMVPLQHRLELIHTLYVGDIELKGESATLLKRDNGYWMEPVPHKEGVFHNGRRVVAPVQLQAGDTLRLGPVQLEVRLK
jgi:predicted component of type VI protein secretion system